MLTGDLVRVRFRKGVIQPPYIAPEDGNLLGLAKTLIGIFERHVGLARYDLDEELKDLKSASRIAGIVMEWDHNQQRIYDLAFTDELTGLANRVHFYQYLVKIIIF